MNREDTIVMLRQKANEEMKICIITVFNFLYSNDSSPISHDFVATPKNFVQILNRCEVSNLHFDSARCPLSVRSLAVAAVRCLS